MLREARGATDFGQLFLAFSIFLIVSAALLVGLLFRLGVEQRAREVGLLRAVGYTTSRIRRLFAAEGLVVTAVGSVVGIAGAIGYASGGRLKLESRNLRDITSQYPEVRGIAAQLGAREAILDGEIIAFGPAGRPSFQELQRRMHVANERQVQRLARETTRWRWLRSR